MAINRILKRRPIVVRVIDFSTGLRPSIERLGVADDNGKTTAADTGLRRDQIHEARRIRDAEVAGGAREG
jgi:hypothetical protein